MTLLTSNARGSTSSIDVARYFSLENFRTPIFNGASRERRNLSPSRFTRGNQTEGQREKNLPCRSLARQKVSDMLSLNTRAIVDYYSDYNPYYRKLGAACTYLHFDGITCVLRSTPLTFSVSELLRIYHADKTALQKRPCHL